MLTEIDWTEDSFQVTEYVSVDLSTEGAIDKTEFIKLIAEVYEANTDYTNYVYCLEIIKNGEPCWYVGESENLKDRITTHIREKDVTNITRIEGMMNRTDALERERELSYQMAIDKNTTGIYGGR